jgi:hypothetical protein
MDKCEAIKSMFGLNIRKEWLERTDQLKNYDFIVLAVDNNKARNIVVESGKEFIDMRAKGREIMVTWVNQKNIETYKKLTVDNNQKGSCQYKSDIDEKTFQNGNDIAAGIGIQMLLNYLRGKEHMEGINLRI